MGPVAIVIEVDDSRLAGYEDGYLAALWHVAQVNPAPYGDRAAGELVERIGREIIRRWLGATPPQLWHHQGRDHDFEQLRKLGNWRGEGGAFLLWPATGPGQGCPRCERAGTGRSTPHGPGQVQCQACGACWSQPTTPAGSGGDR